MPADFLTVEMLFALTALAIVVGGPTYFLYAMARTKPAACPLAGVPHGVSGWLLVFVASIILSIIVLVMDSMSMYQVLSASGIWHWYLLIPAVVMLGINVYVLVLICAVRRAYVVRTVIAMLWVLGPISSLLLTYFSGGEINWRILGQTSFMALIWTGYLLSSKRVACTYGTRSVQQIISLASEQAALELKAQKAAMAKKGQLKPLEKKKKS